MILVSRKAKFKADLEERVSQIMYKMPLYTRKKITSTFSNCMGNAIKEVHMCLSVTKCLPR